MPCGKPCLKCSKISVQPCSTPGEGGKEKSARACRKRASVRKTRITQKPDPKKKNLEEKFKISSFPLPSKEEEEEKKNRWPYAGGGQGGVFRKASQFFSSIFFRFLFGKGYVVHIGVLEMSPCQQRLPTKKLSEGKKCWRESRHLFLGNSQHAVLPLPPKWQQDTIRTFCLIFQVPSMSNPTFCRRWGREENRRRNPIFSTPLKKASHRFP